MPGLWRSASAALALTATACAGAGGGGLAALTPPSRAPYHARAIVTTVVKVYSGSTEGLILGGGPLGRNPGQQMHGLTFTEHDPATHSYLWKFTPGVKLLDRDCHVIDAATMIGVANSPGDVSAVLTDYLGAGDTSAAPPKVEIWNRSGGDPSNCQGEEAARSGQ